MQQKEKKNNGKIISYVRFSKNTQAFIYLINVHRLYHLIMCNIWTGHVNTVCPDLLYTAVVCFFVLYRLFLNLRPHFFTPGRDS